MGYILRKIRRAKWIEHAGISWLPASEIQADALFDLRTTDNILSVWYVEQDQSNLNIIIAALATSRTERISNFDYALIDEKYLGKLGIQQLKKAGDTPSSKANQLWHIDLVELTAQAVYSLAQIISEDGLVTRLHYKEVLAHVQNEIYAGNLELNKMTEELQNKIRQSSS